MIFILIGLVQFFMNQTFGTYILLRITRNMHFDIRQRDIFEKLVEKNIHTKHKICVLIHKVRNGGSSR